MRTTIRLKDELFEEAKIHALKTKKSFTELVHDALTVYLAKENSKQSPRKIVLPTFKGGETKPNVDLNDNSRLLDIMEADDPM